MFARGNRCRGGQGAGSPSPGFVAGIDELLAPVELAGTVPVAPVVVDFQLSHAFLPASSSYDTCHRPFQVPPVLDPISQRIFHPYNDLRARTDGKSFVPERSLEDNHQAPGRGFGGEKGSQLNYRPYSNYWPHLWRCWISLLGAHQLPEARRYGFGKNAFPRLAQGRDTFRPLLPGTELGKAIGEGEWDACGGLEDEAEVGGSYFDQGAGVGHRA